MRRLTEKQIKDSIQNIDFEPLKIKLEDRKTQASDGAMRLVIGWKNGAEYFLPEILGQATPKQVDLSLFRLEKMTKAASGKKAGDKSVFPIIIAPYLSEQTLNRLADSEISGIDLSGNGVVVIPGKLFVYRTGEKNKFLSNAPIKNVFRGTSSLIAKVFFNQPEYENIGEILNEITKRGGKTTFPTVSKVLKTLEEELLVSKTEMVRLLDAKKLLEKLVKNYRRPQISRTISIKCADLSSALEKMAENAKKQNTLFAWNYPARYTVMPSDTFPMKIYTESIDELLEGVDFGETNRFPDLILLETDEPTVYFDRRKEQESYFLSPLEIFLQLSTEGKREQEAASLMIKKLLEFKY
ncbi:MAG: hypothetical protein ABJA66_20355 [Actinomycetota bacterium]